MALPVVAEAANSRWAVSGSSIAALNNSQVFEMFKLLLHRLTDSPKTVVETHLNEMRTKLAVTRHSRTRRS